MLLKLLLLCLCRSACAFCAGEPGQLEASLRQLDQALDAGRYHLQQREATANRVSPDVDSTYMGYVSLPHVCLMS